MKHFYCTNCGCLVATIKNGSKLKKGLVFLCEKCYKELKDGNLFNDIFGGLK